MSGHPSIATFGPACDCLLVGGIRIDRLAERVGGTPFFAYERAKIDQRVGALREALPASVALHYAIKANPMPALVQHLARLVDGFDVASAGEMHVALDTGMAPGAVSFAGPGKTDTELRQAIAAGVIIEIESFSEADRLAAIAAALGIRPSLAIRVNPDFQLRGSGMRMGGGAQQFGVDAECVPALLRDIEVRDLDFVGFHIFAGSQNLDASNITAAQNSTVDLVLRLCGDAPRPIRYLNIGGGFGIPYFAQDKPLDLGPVAANLMHLVEDILSTRLPTARVTLELGRYLVGECGVYVTRILDRKVSRGKTFLVVDGGLHHQLAASGNFGQAIRRNYPLVIGNRMSAAPSETVSVVGCLCTPLDLLGDDVWLPPAAVGDLVVIFQSGAYGLTASPTAFLGHPTPAQVLV